MMDEPEKIATSNSKDFFRPSWVAIIPPKNPPKHIPRKDIELNCEICSKVNPNVSIKDGVI